MNVVKVFLAGVFLARVLTGVDMIGRTKYGIDVQTIPWNSRKDRSLLFVFSVGEFF